MPCVVDHFSTVLSLDRKCFDTVFVVTETRMRLDSPTEKNTFQKNVFENARTFLFVKVPDFGTTYVYVLLHIILLQYYFELLKTWIKLSYY